MDKIALRKRLVTERLDMPDRLARADLLQRVMRIWLVSRPDTVIGAYWPIKGEFDPLPALYRWQEDGVLSRDNSNFEKNLPDVSERRSYDALNFIASITKVPTGEEGSGEVPKRKIGLPVVDKINKTLTFYAWYPGCPMEEDAYGIPKPKDTEVVSPTLLFVPCVGYGDRGYRLGYGGGFYDRTLAALSPKPVTVGLGYSHGYVPEFAPEPHDVALDAILTDVGQAFP
jgi:5-formyltetrahydrofolate cyclo-ligase